ncbi:aspartate/glutamate racemase family protein [Benzoatithermus flavus]|uniref:Aspartate/glutamate racemase family protein n=1 Tax=Benzoatithermus flavus TaxID=3108223 RepID=A0ABU8XKR3_9PROT
MTRRTLLGMLTPSSNTILEPVSSAMVAALPDVSVHFGRFRVTEISLDQAALGQFAYEPMLEAASLLADARVQAICWNGTSASWLGLDQDRALCAAITERTGIEATSSVLALVEIFRLTGVERFGLVTPYLDEIQERIVPNFRKEGFACVAERHLGDRGNFSFSEVSAATLTAMVREVAGAKPQAITILCTNLKGAPLVERLEQEIGIPIYDSVATALWSSLRLAGADPRRVQGWGRLFREVA